jgi:serine-type D-Ala-D-Ala endopeptidase (penicillin-binding protein 7)
MAGRLVSWTLVAMLALTLVHPGSAEARKRKRGGSKSKPIPALTKDGRPNVQAFGAIVVDLDSGEEVYAKNADELRFIASTTKIFVAMVVRARGVDLEGETVITDDDQKRARGGAKSRLLVGRRFKNKDLMRAMLIGSDNRACTAIARAAGMTPDELITAMNALARKLGLKKTKFTDPSGLRGNESTAREMAVALREALSDPLIAEIMATREVDVVAADSGETVDKGKKVIKKSTYVVHYNNTNHSLRSSKYTVVGGKTGYTDLARYCLVIATKIGGKRYAMSFLGAEGELTRFADFNRVCEWIEGHPTTASLSPAAAPRAKGVGALADPPPAAVTPRLAR